SITEISTLCGYSSLGNFQRYFKKLVGMPPSEYRKLFLKQEV
ncbi:MAG: AraC family transcriptional regulator, partial [Oscillospiraceae bacterium]|nr:AraC family transcriptional regulator [Oscillospiraceae bacterium]